MAEDKGFICQTCGLLRSKEEVKRIVSEITAISDKELKYKSPGSILFNGYMGLLHTFSLLC